MGEIHVKLGARREGFAFALRHFRVRAFTLLEMVGVLAVISILAAALVPVVIKRMDVAAWNGETSSLSAMKDALTQYIIKSNTIPSQTTWATAIGGELGLAPANITTTPRNLARAFLIDTSGWLGALPNFPTLCYTQQPGGVPSIAPNNAGPASARLMIVSSIGKALPVSSGAPGTAAFNAVWNTSWPNVPSTWAGWGGNGADLVIQRINLQPLFHRVVLENTFGEPAGQYSVNNYSPTNIPGSGGTGINAYYLNGTTLNLYNSAGTTNLVTEIVRGDLSRVFEEGVWRDEISVGLTNVWTTATSLGSVAAMYYPNAPGPGSSSGATPQSALAAMTAYMDAYSMWSATSPCFAGGLGNGIFSHIIDPSNHKGSTLWISDLNP